GLDVHARSVVAAAIDTATGELFRSRLCPDHEEVLRWLGELPGPVAVAYEAGPTGFGLARALAAVGVRCEVVAPSKLQRPAGDRVKTDAKDALHLARLLRMDEFTGVRVPTEAEEAARDLVRAREDVRGELMRARHRTSKLLLRRGIVYSGGQGWSVAHHAWLRQQRFDLPGLQSAYDAAYEAVLLTEARRDRLDKAISEMAQDLVWSPVVTRLSCLRGVSTLTAFGLAVEIGDWHRFTGSPARPSAPTWAWCPVSTPAASGVVRARSPRPATPMPAGCSLRPPGTTGPDIDPAPRCKLGGTRHPQLHAHAAMLATTACTSAGTRSPSARSGP
ncbi:MAG TPA: transposase, partial [Pseudonocardiaceae bacterium]|nr:transposase [Pseudonocardiaceae bacterium]